MTSFEGIMRIFHHVEKFKKKLKVEKIHERVPSISSRLKPWDWQPRAKTNIELFLRVYYMSKTKKSFKKGAVSLETAAQKLQISRNTQSIRAEPVFPCRCRSFVVIQNDERKVFWTSIYLKWKEFWRTGMNFWTCK